MDELTDHKINRMSQFLSTEHFSLQGMRSGTISESNGRLGGYLSAVSMSIVALAFVAQVSEIDTVFLGFSIIIFPILIFLGIGTWIRLIQLGITDVLLVQAINRIRHYYLETMPEAGPYFSLSQYDDMDSIRTTVLPVKMGFEGIGSAGFQVTVINSVLIGAFAGILAAGVLNVNTSWVIAIGIIGMILGFLLQAIYSGSVAMKVSKNIEVRFPMQKDSGESTTVSQLQ